MLDLLTMYIAQPLAELYRSPMAAVLVFAWVARAYSGQYDWSTVPKALLVGAVAAISSPNSVSWILNFQRDAFEAAMKDLGLVPGALEMIRSGQIESTFISNRATMFGWGIFSALLIDFEGRKWFKTVGWICVLTIIVAVLTPFFRHALIEYGLPKMVGTRESWKDLSREATELRSRKVVEYYVSLPLSAAAYAMTVCVLVKFLVTFSRKNSETLGRHPLADKVMTILITLIILGFALCGFLFLDAFKAVLWLLFWIAAYPLALSFTRAKPLQGDKLVSLYKEGMKQIPIIGKFFSIQSSEQRPRRLKKNQKTPTD